MLFQNPQWKQFLKYRYYILWSSAAFQKYFTELLTVKYRTYFAAISLFRSRLLSRPTKIILYETLIRPVVSYGEEAWTLTKEEEQALLIFERKIEEYMVLNMKTENGKVGRIEN